MTEYGNGSLSLTVLRISPAALQPQVYMLLLVAPLGSSISMPVIALLRWALMESGVCRVPEHCPQAILDIMNRCQQELPEKRPTAAEIIAIIIDSMPSKRPPLIL